MRLNIDRTTTSLGIGALLSQGLILGLKHFAGLEIPGEVETSLNTLVIFALSIFIK